MADHHFAHSSSGSRFYDQLQWQCKLLVCGTIYPFVRFVKVSVKITFVRIYAILSDGYSSLIAII